MKYVDLDNGMRVGVGADHIRTYRRRNDSFGNMYWEVLVTKSTRPPEDSGLTPMFRDAETEAYLAKVIAALVEKLEEPNEQA